MTNQEAFDKAAIGLIRQGRKSITDNGATCLYRGPGGSKCAIGHNIPDEQYQPVFEDTTLPVLIQDVPALNGLDVNFASSLQALHDSENPRQWRYALRLLAGRYRLSTAILDAEPLGPAERP